MPRKRTSAPEPVVLAAPPIVDPPMPVYRVILTGTTRMTPTKDYRKEIEIPAPTTARLFHHGGVDYEFVGLEKNVRVYRHQTRP